MPARRVAFQSLTATSPEFITDRFADAAAREPLSPRDRGLAMELAYGVVRRRATLDVLLAECVSRPRENVEDDLWTLLQLGVYQLLFLTSIPDHAAVHETVELARSAGSSRWCGMVNGVLRSVSRLLDDAEASVAAADAIPLTAGRFRRLTKPLLPDPVSQSVEYFSRAFGFPEWLVERWWERSSWDELVQRGFWFNTPPPVWLRSNALKTSAEELIPQLQADDATLPVLDAGPLRESVCAAESRPIANLPAFAAGLFTVQDLSAMHVVDLLDPQPGERILDLCAAPGGKTTHIAERMRNTGEIIATDVAADRLARVCENANRLGVSIVETRLINRDLTNLPRGRFDAILVDAPCSNTGVLGKRPDARWRIQPADLVELSRQQRQLLNAVARQLRPGGRLVYSTCSIEPEENETVVNLFLADQPGFRLEREVFHQPGQPADGGYAALIKASKG